MILRATTQALYGRAVPSTLRIASTSASKNLSSTSTPSQILSGTHRHAHTTRIRRDIQLSDATRRAAAVAQWRWASTRSAGQRKPPNKPPPGQIAQDRKNAESPWTEEPRSPAPGQNTAPASASASASSTPEYHSKLRASNVEAELARIEQNIAKLRNEQGTPEEPAPQATGPLPDLRYGIPSSFGEDATSAKPSASENLGLNITEDPASGGGRSEEDTPREAYVSSIDRRRQRFARWMYIAATAFAAGAFAWLGREWTDDAETKAHPDAPQGLSPVAWYARFRERIGGQFSHYTEPAFQKLLPDPPSDPAARIPYTLVLSLEDLLVHSEWTRQEGYKVAKRPGVDYFLRYLCQYYELVIFTTVQTANGDLILRQLDPYTLCLPLFRDATRYMNGEHVKDLSYLNRPLDKTIIIDTNPAHTSLQPENAIILPKWSGSRKDPHTTDLVALIPFLEYIAGMELSDVRKVLASYKGTHIPTEFHRRELKAREEFNKRYEAEKKRRGNLPGAGVLSSLSGALGFKPQPTMQIPGEQSPQEAFAEGKMLSDLMRERGQRAYLELEKQIKDNGEMWLKMRAEEEKKAMEEGMKNMTGGMFSFFGGGGGGEKKE